MPDAEKSESILSMPNYDYPSFETATHFYHGKEDCLKWFHLKKQGPSKKQNILDYCCNNRVTSW